MVTDNFVWILGNGSKWGNNEIRYSIRSVVKYHPNANVLIIGEKPEWYAGDHIYMPDDSIRYVNKWNKVIRACQEFDSFVQMDDDFFLTEPFEPIVYYDGSLQEKYRISHKRSTQYADMIKRTHLKFPKAKNYLLHIPLPVKSDVLKEPDKRVSLRTFYGCKQEYFPEVERKDVKSGYTTLKTKLDEPFFSTTDHIGRSPKQVTQLFPNKSKYEH